MTRFECLHLQGVFLSPVQNTPNAFCSMKCTRIVCADNQNSVLRTPRLQVVQSGQNMADIVKCDLDIEHDQYIMLTDAQVHLVQ
jgi:hypothetical protein